MYGMVNKAVEEMIVLEYGRDAWEEVRREAGIDVEVFISTEGYDDSVTYALVGAAVRKLGVPADELLGMLGEHWILHTASEGYEYLMDSAGNSVADVLANLYELHSQVLLLLPKLRPPEFRITDLTDSSLILHYYSHRPGLQPFVMGLVRGLGKRFGSPVSVRLLDGRHTGLDHDRFEVRWETPEAETPR